MMMPRASSPRRFDALVIWLIGLVLLQFSQPLIQILLEAANPSGRPGDALAKFVGSAGVCFFGTTAIGTVLVSHCSDLYFYGGVPVARVFSDMRWIAALAAAFISSVYFSIAVLATSIDSIGQSVPIAEVIESRASMMQAIVFAGAVAICLREEWQRAGERLATRELLLRISKR
jgi:hypothetical protein